MKTDEDNETGAIGISGPLIPDLFARMGCSLARHSTEKLGEIESIKLQQIEGTKISDNYSIPKWLLVVDFVNDHDPATCKVCQSEREAAAPDSREG